VALTPESVVQMAVANLGETTAVVERHDLAAVEGRKARRSCSTTYERKRILAKHNWSWATKRKTLTDATATEAEGAAGPTRTRFPSSVLRVIAIDLGFRNSEDPAGFDP
jgi:hypothetical protein